MPRVPSTSISSPSRIVTVAMAAAVTVGMPYSRPTIAAWERVPPPSQTQAAILPNAVFSSRGALHRARAPFRATLAVLLLTHRPCVAIHPTQCSASACVRFATHECAATDGEMRCSRAHCVGEAHPRGIETQGNCPEGRGSTYKNAVTLTRRRRRAPTGRSAERGRNVRGGGVSSATAWKKEMAPTGGKGPRRVS